MFEVTDGFRDLIEVRKNDHVSISGEGFTYHYGRGLTGGMNPRNESYRITKSGCVSIVVNYYSFLLY
jgi:hypothetical protein